MKKALSILILVLLPSTLVAHPHMFLDSSVNLAFKNGVPSSLTLTWTLDQFFSSSIIYDYDKDQNGRFSAAENKLIEKEAFSNLLKFGYFVLIRTEKGRNSPKQVRDFKATQDAGKLIYQFTVDLDPTELGKEFYVAVFDTSFFCAVNYNKPPVAFTGLSEVSGKPQWELVEDKNHPIYYNPQGKASDKREYKKWEPGLVTAYPKEIRFKYGQ